MQRYVKTRQAAAYLGVSQYRIRELVAGGHLRPIRIPGDPHFHFDLAALDKFMLQHTE